MHAQAIEEFQHEHYYLGVRHAENERRTWLVVALTAAMMLVEIIGGHMFGSMALIADGWHMSTHVTALGIAALAYRFARRHAHDSRFSFGTGKLGDLAGFTSAILLAGVAVFIGVESLLRLFNPVAIHYTEAIPIAVLGLFVNLASAWLLGGHEHAHADEHGSGHAEPHAHDHHDDHPHDHAHHDHAHHDHNFRAAYVHVLADALTSLLAIAGLLAGRYLGLGFLDPVMGLIGTVVIAAWAYTLIRGAGAVLLDVVPDPGLGEQIRARLERGGDRIADLHLWRVGPGHTAVILTVVSDTPCAPAEYKTRLAGIVGLSHVTVEVQPCPGAHGTGG